MAFRIVCNMCGKEFHPVEDSDLFQWHKFLSEDSRHRGNFALDLCPECVDRLLDEYLIPNCKISPIEYI